LRAAAALACKQKAHSLTSFDGFGLNEAITRAIAGAPSQIQEQTISIAMSRRDAIGIAQTGTGKTAVFAPPILQHLVTDERPADTAQRLPPAVTHNVR
jgi:ATP-dependent RNA helicase RhlE